MNTKTLEELKKIRDIDRLIAQEANVLSVKRKHSEYNPPVVFQSFRDNKQLWVYVGKKKKRLL